MPKVLNLMTTLFNETGLCKISTLTWIFILAICHYFAVPAVSQSGASSLAVISDVHGDVFLKKSQRRDQLKAVFGMQLMVGDQVRTEKNARATVLFSNGNLINLGANSDITISGNAPAGGGTNVGAGLAGNFSDLAMRQDSHGEMGVLIDLRSNETAQLVIPLTPCNTMISTLSPKLSWESSRPADEFVVRLYNSQGLVWEHRTTEPFLEYPEEEPPLAYGTSYFWNVEGEDMIHTFRSLNQKFTVLDEQQINNMMQEKQRIKELFADDPENSSCHSLLGTYYAQIGLLEEAIGEFELVRDANPEATLPHEILGSLYSDVGKKDLAIAELQKALALEKEK